jgi:hypothetical protein
MHVPEEIIVIPYISLVAFGRDLKIEIIFICSMILLGGIAKKYINQAFYLK